MVESETSMIVAYWWRCPGIEAGCIQ